MTWKLSKTCQFQGHAIKYEVKGSGPALVMIHGTPWSSYNLRHLIDGLSKTHTVYFYDLLGYGQSSKPDSNVSLGIQNEVLNHLLDVWGLNEPAILGHDFGGSTVLRTHLLNHREFSKIVLINPVALSPWGSPFFKHVNLYEEAFAGIPDYIHEAVVRAYIATAAFKPLASNVENVTVAPWLGEIGKAAFYRQIAQAKSSYTEEVQARYPEISVPVLILWGEEDVWIPAEKGADLHQLISSSVYQTVPHAGHLVIEENPESLLNFISPFLKSEVT